MALSKHIGCWVVTMFLLVGTLMAMERDPLIPRVPSNLLAVARMRKNPVPPTPDNLAKGKELFEDKAMCFSCHGPGGNGEGKLGKLIEPSPRDFTNPAFHKAKTPGEMFWVIKNGIPGSGMTALVPSLITEEEAWMIINYERSFAGTGREKDR